MSIEAQAVADEALERSFERFVRELELASFRDRHQAVCDGHEVDVTVVPRVRSDGHEVEIEESMFAVLDVHGRPQRIASIARDVTELARLRRATQVLTDAGHLLPALARAGSEKMLELVRCAELVAKDRDATVLTLGKTGAGKTWLARRIHQMSPRAGKSFLEINCAGLAQQLVESELFGHERGAFTAAATQKRSLVETAEDLNASSSPARRAAEP